MGRIIPYIMEKMFETTNQLKAIRRIGKPQAVVVEILHYGNKHGAFLELGFLRS